MTRMNVLKNTENIQNGLHILIKCKIMVFYSPANIVYFYSKRTSKQINILLNLILPLYRQMLFLLFFRSYAAFNIVQAGHSVS